MESPFAFAFLALFSLIMMMSIVDARPDPGEYWQDKLVRSGTSVSLLPTKKSDCHTVEARNHDHLANKKRFVDHDDKKGSAYIESYDKEFEPRPNVLVYDNGINPSDDKKGVVKDFETKPNLSVYDNGLEEDSTSNKDFEPRLNGKSLKNEPSDSATSHLNGNSKKEGKKFVKDFEPRPNLSVYDSGAGLKGKKTSDKEFKPKPNALVFDNGAGLKDKKTFDEEFEPRPNASVYNNGIGLKDKKTYDEDFEPRPNLSVYDDKTDLKSENSFNKDFEPRPNVLVYED